MAFDFLERHNTSNRKGRKENNAKFAKEFKQPLQKSKPETGTRTAVLIRSAIAADIPAMMALERASITAAHWPEHQYEATFADSALRIALVLEQDAKLQAFLIARSVAEEWELENIAVSGPARRRGLGSRLLGHFLDRVRVAGGRAVFLEVRQSNHAARALYEKWAFEECGRRLKYYRQPEEDAITYRLDLG